MKVFFVGKVSFVSEAKNHILNNRDALSLYANWLDKDRKRNWVKSLGQNELLIFQVYEMKDPTKIHFFSSIVLTTYLLVKSIL